MAEWVAVAYDAYLHHRTLRDLLDPSGARYSPKSRPKLDFLMRHGFFTQELYGRVTTGS